VARRASGRRRVWGADADGGLLLRQMIVRGMLGEEATKGREQSHED